MDIIYAVRFESKYGRSWRPDLATFRTREGAEAFIKARAHLALSFRKAEIVLVSLYD